MQDGDVQQPEVGAVQGPCPLCGAPVEARDTRCPSCGLSLAGVYGRPGPFSEATFWWMAAGLGIVYLVALLVVALAR